MSRSDNLRVADIVEAAQQLGELVADGRDVFDADWTRRNVGEMGAPSDDDRVEVLSRFLSGLTRGADAHQLSADIAELHRRSNTFPGEVLMELAADALDLADYGRDCRVE